MQHLVSVTHMIVFNMQHLVSVTHMYYIVVLGGCSNWRAVGQRWRKEITGFF